MHAKLKACLSILILACTALLVLPSAAETLRVGKAVPEAFSFVPLDVGIKIGAFEKYGLDIQEFGFGGSAKLQQALAANSIDIGLGSGPEIIFAVKGAPVKAVAAMAGAPLLLTIVVKANGPIKSVADLKGRRVSVSTVGSLTYWLVSELSRRQGWGPMGIDITPLGDTKPQLIALQRGEVDAIVTDLTTALDEEKAGRARILFHFGPMVPDFHIHMIYASNTVIHNRAPALHAFLKGWFETIAYMRTHKAETVAIAAPILGASPDITAKTYDALMPMFSDTGFFDPKAMDTITRSFTDLKLLPSAPNLKLYYTEALLP